MKNIKLALFFFFSLFFLFCSTPFLEANWTTPVTLATTAASNQLFTSRVAVGPNGNMVAVWSQQTNGQNLSTISASGFNASTNTWSTPVSISTPASFNYNLLQVQVNSSGNAVIVWPGVVVDGTSFSVFSARYNLSGNTLTAISNVATSQPGDFLSLSLALCMDSTGQSTVSFFTNPSTNTYIIKSLVLGPSSTTWSSVNDITLTTSPAFLSSITNSSNTVFLFFNNGAGAIPCYQKTQSGTSWTQLPSVTNGGGLAKTLLTNNGSIGNPIGINAAGDLTVLWNASNTLYSSTLFVTAPTAWQQTSAIFTDSLGALGSLAVGSNGDAFLISYTSSGINSSARTYSLPYGSTTWSSFSQTVANFSDSVSLGVDSNSNPLFTCRNLGTGMYCYVAAPNNTAPVASSAQISGNIASVTTSSSIAPGNIAVAPNGNTVILWTDSRGAYTSSYYVMDSTNSTITTDTTSVQADNFHAALITLTLLDSRGSPVIGHPVTLVQTGSTSFDPPIGTTDSNGRVVFAATDSVVETVVFRGIDLSDNKQTTSTVTVSYTSTTSPANSTVSANPTSTFANGVSTSAIKVTLNNYTGDPVPNRTVVLSAGSGSSTITPASVVTNSSGVANFTVKDTVAESVTYTATDTTDSSFPIVIQTKPTVTFIAQTDANISTISASPTSLAIGSNTSTITVTLKTAGGALVSGHNVSLSQGSGSSTITPTTVTTNSSGVATFTVSDSTIQNVTYTATDTTIGQTLAHTATVAFVDATSPSSSTISASPINVGADGVGTSTISVTLKNLQGSVITGGHTVTLSGSGTTTITPTTATSNGSGVATFTVKSSTIQNVTYTATDTSNNTQITPTATVNFVQPISKTASTVQASPVVLNGAVAQSTITVQVFNLAGTTPVSGQVISLNPSIAGSTITPTTATTNSSGIAVFTVTNTPTTSPTAESTVYTATDTTNNTVITQTATVNFVIATNTTLSTVTSNPLKTFTQTGLSTGSSTISVLLKDGSGNAISGHSVSLSALSGSSSISAPSGISDSSGLVTFTVTDAVQETVTYRATDTTTGTVLTNTGSVQFISQTSPSLSKIFTLIPSAVANGSSYCYYAIALFDVNGNELPNHVLLITANGGHSVITPVSSTTDMFGQAAFSATDTFVETVTYTVTDTTAGIIVGQATGTFTPYTNAANSTVTASPTQTVAGSLGSSTVTVTLKDVNNQVVPSTNVTLTANSVNSTITPSSTTTNSSGVATFTVKDSNVETVTYTAKDTTNNITVTQTASVVFVTPINPALSTVSASPTSILADNTTTSTITVTLITGSTTPVVGHSVSLTPSGGSSTITTSSDISNSSGKVFFQVKDSVGENVTYTAVDTTNNMTVTQTATVSFISLINPALSTIVASPTSVPADNSISTITVTLLNGTSGSTTPVAGHTVTLTPSGGSSTITPLSGGVTDSNGQALFQVKDLVNETVTYTAKDTTNNITLTNTVPVTFLQTINGNSSTVVASPSSVMADGTTNSTITVTLIHGTGGSATPVAGHTVSLTPSVGTHSIITPISSVSNSSGQFIFTVEDSTIEVVTYTATDTTVNTGIVQTTEVNFASPINPTLSTVLASPTNVAADGTSSSTITVTLLNGSLGSTTPVANHTVSLSGNNASIISPSTAVTNSSGVATFTVKSGTIQTVTYTATDNTISTNVNQTALVNFTEPISPSQSTITANPLTVIANNADLSLVTVTLMNAGNTAPVVGHNVTLTPLSGSSVVFNATNPSNSSGEVTFEVRDGSIENVTYSATDTTNGTTLLNTVTIDFISKVNPTTSTVVASPTTVIVGGGNNSIVTVTLVDYSGNPVQGHTVVLTALSGSSQITPLSGVTNVFGEVEFTLTDTNFESVTYQATDTTDNIPLLNTATVTFVSNTSAVNSSVTVNPDVVFANGVSTGVVTVTLKNTQNPSSPVVNHLVSLTSDSTTSVIGAASGPSNSLGVVTFQVSDSVVEEVIYSAQDTTNGVFILETAEVNFITPIDPSLSTLTASPTEVPPNGTSFSTITVTLLDASSNPVPNHGVTLTAGSGSSTITPASGVSNGMGQVLFQVRDFVTENVTYTARDTTEGINLNTTLTVPFTPFVNITLSTVTAVPTSLFADGIATSTITVTLLDNSSNPVVGYNVTLMPNGGSSIITPASGTSNSSGQITFTVRDNFGENVVYTARDTTDNVSLVQTATVNFISIAPSPPLNFKGVKQEDIFASQREYEHVLTWEKSVDPDVLGYRIYEGSRLLATVKATSPLQVTFHNRKKDKTYVYKLVAYSSAVEESTPLFVTLVSY